MYKASLNSFLQNIRNDISDIIHFALPVVPIAASHDAAQFAINLMRLRRRKSKSTYACDFSLDGGVGDAVHRRRFPTMRRRDDLVALPTTSRAHQAEFRQVPGVQAAAPEADGG